MLHFLHIREVPFFEETISNGKEILEHIDKDAAQKFLAETPRQAG